MNRWERVKARLNVIRPLWFPAAIVLAVSAGLQHPQAVDAANAIAEKGFFNGRNFSLLAALLLLATSSWYFPRALLYVRYRFTPEEDPGAGAPRHESWRRWAPRLLGILPCLSATVAFGRGAEWAFVALYLAFTVAFAAFIIGRRKFMLRTAVKIELHDAMPHTAFVFVVAFSLFAFVLLAIFHVSKVTAPQLVGPLGIIFLAASGWLAFGSIVLMYPTYRYRLPSLLLILLVLTTTFSFWNDNHRVRTLSDAPLDDERSTVVGHFAEWLEYRGPAIDDRNGDYPVFIVAAEGGGIRAAYWTAAVLGGLQNADPRFGCHVFALSGVSGGSLGGAAFAADLADFVETHALDCSTATPPADLGFGQAHLDFLDEDFLSPALAGMLYSDLAQRLLPTTGKLALPDRATYLESAWEQEWAAQPPIDSDRFANSFLDLWSSGKNEYNVPALFLNGTWVETGGRVVTANLRPASEQFVKLDDMLDVLQKDISLATAVHMSARFTYVSPAGTIETSNGERHVVDGGYFENSGALTAAEIYQALHDDCQTSEKCRDRVRFVALIISNNPANPNGVGEFEERAVGDPSECEQTGPTQTGNASGGGKGPPALRETLSPIVTLFATRMARGLHAEDRLRSAVGACDTIRFQLRDTGQLKVPLGWVLSAETQQTIAEQAASAPGMTRVLELLAREP